MRERQPPPKQRNDPILASDFNDANEVITRQARSTTGTGMFTRHAASTLSTAAHLPWQQQLLEISDEGEIEGTYLGKIVYYDHYQQKWLVGGNEYNVDPRGLSKCATAKIMNVGDRVVAYWDNQRAMYVPIDEVITEFWASITYAIECRPNVWKYGFKEVELLGIAQKADGACEAGMWSIKGDGLTGVSHNTIEVPNSESGMQGNGIDLEDCAGCVQECPPGGTCECKIVPIGIGAVVKMSEIKDVSGVEGTECEVDYWFSVANQWQFCPEGSSSSSSEESSSEESDSSSSSSDDGSCTGNIIRVVTDVYCEGDDIMVCTVDICYDPRFVSVGPEICPPDPSSAPPISGGGGSSSEESNSEESSSSSI